MLYAIGAHIMWGLFPLYWKLVGNISSVSLVSHRIVWAFFFLAIGVPILIAKGKEVPFDEFVKVIRSPRVWVSYTIAAVMLAINWLAFIWAVTHGQVLQASLGYYINPLLSILLGVIVLGERLQTIQWIAVGVAGVGVSIMTIHGGGLPWASIAMASSFSIYGLIKKRSPLPSLSGLLLECSVLLIPAVFWLACTVPEAGKVNIPVGLFQWSLMIGGGVITILPLGLFAAATKRIPLSTAGVLQYVGPTLQFLVGAVIFGESFDGGRIAGFACVWLGSAMYLLAIIRSARLAPKTPRPNINDEVQRRAKQGHA